MLLRLCLIAVISFGSASAFGQTGQPRRPALPNRLPLYTVQAGTHIPLGLINSVSTKHSVAGRSHLSRNRLSRS